MFVWRDDTWNRIIKCFFDVELHYNPSKIDLIEMIR